MWNNFQADELLFTSRGTAALNILLTCHPEITHLLLPVNICEIVIAPLLKLGIHISYYDVNENSGNAQLTHIKEAYTSEQQALLVVHNFGNPLAITTIKKWCTEHRIFLIEDVCNALGATYDKKLLGTFGDAAIFSFGYAKIIELGIGGALRIENVDKRQLAAQKINSLDVLDKEVYLHTDKLFQNNINHYRKNKDWQALATIYQEYTNGFNVQPDKQTIEEIKAELIKLPDNITSRNAHALTYEAGLTNPGIIKIPLEPGSVVWRYTFLIKNADKRDDFIAFLRKNDILCSTWFPPIHHIFSGTKDEKKFPRASSFGKRVVNLFVDFRVNPAIVDKTILLINQYSFS